MEKKVIINKIILKYLNSNSQFKYITLKMDDNKMKINMLINGDGNTSYNANLSTFINEIEELKYINVKHLKFYHENLF